MLGVMGVAAGDEAMDASLGPVVGAEGSDEAEPGSVAGAWSMGSLPGVSGRDLRSRGSTLDSWNMDSSCVGSLGCDLGQHGGQLWW